MKRSQKTFLMVALLLWSSIAEAANYKIDHLEPPFWWADMKNPHLQLLVHGEDISDLAPELEYPGVRLQEVTRVQNPNYLFLDLHISSDAKPGTFEIQFKKKDKTVLSYDYELREREPGSAMRQGFDQSDALYLITPDRFANGNPGNDEVEHLAEGLNRSFPGGRHGGDIRGILDHLDYIDDMGFTSIWLNPVLENDMEEYSYHGYSTTDFYNVDARFGSNEEYLELTDAASEKGIGMIMDMIVNHCGSEHWWMEDMPMDNWINFDAEFSPTSHKRTTVQDEYASKEDLKHFNDGWFVATMPDLNQRNPLMANYLIQNAVWWVEYTGLTGIRMDTYPYSDKHFLTQWTKRIMEEYPNFNIVGEEWSVNPVVVSYWQRGKDNKDNYVSYLPSLMDFPLQNGMSSALREDETWGTGFIKLYEMLANDVLYADPYNLVVFGDNHDMSRIYTQLNEDPGLFKMAMAYVFTIRGIPQVLYGTEILMSNKGTTDHGIIRSDFPGGWDGDETNAFTGVGMAEKSLDAQNFVKTLLNWRKDQPVIHHGDLMHYAPLDGIYVYFRYNDDDMVMVVLNKNEEAVNMDTLRFHEMLTGKSSARNVLTGDSFDLGGHIKVPARSPLVLEIMD